MPEAANDLPLCVDLDGTLILSDALVEGFLRLFKKNPLQALCAGGWLLGGKARLKAQVARHAHLDPASLPYNEPFLEWLREQHRAGRRLVLCTASAASVATDIAAHLGIFDVVLSSTESVNLAGRNKARVLEQRFGKGGFDYAGNETADLVVWQVARRAIVVNPVAALRRRISEVPSLEQTFTHRRLKTPTAWLRALRVHQWAKNVLLFVPALVSHRIVELPVLAESSIAFLCFGVCASGNYILNDLLDLESDRTHPRKRRRPFAAGELPLVHGIFASLLLLALGIGAAALLLGKLFVAVLLIYLACTFWYSWVLKRIAMVDVLTLAGLYTIRVIAGGAAIGLAPSFWLLAFSMFMFLSLALAKRYTELKALLGAGRFEASGRDYNTGDLTLLLSSGVASAYLSVLVMALYLNSGTPHIYRHPQALWMLCPLMLYWVNRVWRKAHRGELHHDPVVFALRDRPSLLVVCLCAVLILIAT